MTQSYVGRNSCMIWLIHMNWFLRVTRLVEMFNLTHSHVWNESLICVTRLIHIQWHGLLICVTWLIHMCDMTQSYAGRRSCVIPFIHVSEFRWVTQAVYKWVMPCIWMTCPTCEWVVLHVRIREVILINDLFMVIQQKLTNWAQPHDDSPSALPHMNLHLSTRYEGNMTLPLRDERTGFSKNVPDIYLGMWGAWQLRSRCPLISLFLLLLLRLIFNKYSYIRKTKFIYMYMGPTSNASLRGTANGCRRWCLVVARGHAYQFEQSGRCWLQSQGTASSTTALRPQRGPACARAAQVYVSFSIWTWGGSCCQ